MGRTIGIGTSVFGRLKHDSGFESDTLSGIESSAGSGSAGEVPEGLPGLYDQARCGMLRRVTRRRGDWKEVGQHG